MDFMKAFDKVHNGRLMKNIKLRNIRRNIELDSYTRGDKKW